jgi:coenzyme F420-0:L-glutamate ligase/coenzyme F420-1:gamma-L-glutamate ligase
MTEPTQPVAMTVLPVTGIGEVVEGDDLAGLLGAHADLRDGDVLLVTSKVVSKAEGRAVAADKASAVAAETDRVVATRGATMIVRTRAGLVMANAGVDASNTPAGTVVLLPEDPDASARRLRERLAAAGGPNVAVLVTDTFGRAWRTGQTDVAVGAAGLDVLRDYAGRVDEHGNELAVTAPAVADELAGAADLVKGKLAGVPAAVVRGLPGLVLPRGGARARRRRAGPGRVRGPVRVRRPGGRPPGAGCRPGASPRVRRRMRCGRPGNTP